MEALAEQIIILTLYRFGELSSEAFFLGVHLADSTGEYVYAPGAKAAERASRLASVIADYSNHFAEAENIVSGDQLQAWTYYTEFSGSGFSVTLMFHADDLSKKEVWTTAYGSQAQSTLTISNARVVRLETGSPTSPEEFYVIGDFAFSCTLYTSTGQSKLITGTATMGLYRFLDL